ncbi:DUF3883 domain-containing protein [Bosea sp. LjRoot90]|uniref:DUF3883 domain-containing protein n=1 Tax=Bosea sp. LjRoot90 TaxID=3342342 RepID=UPI003ECEF3DD
MAQSRYTPEVRLDPFATSMRNFDDVSPNLKAIREGGAPAVNDPTQRVADLRSAGFLGDDGKSLSALGAKILPAWERFGVDNDDIGDEMSRLLLMVLVGHDLEDSRIGSYVSYWRAIRKFFSPFELIDSWDKLYVLNYLDARIEGFSPGDVLRSNKARLTDVSIDILSSFKALGLSQTAMDGAVRIEDAIKGKVPRGRHRATFCMALEIAVAGPSSAIAIIEKFGVPRGPRVWVPFSSEQKTTLMSILDEYASDGGSVELAADIVVAPEAVEAVDITVGAAGQEPDLVPFVVPNITDFSGVLVGMPERKTVVTQAVGANSTEKKKKIDYVKRAKANSLVGSAGEEFAIKFEKWRLKDFPELLAKIAHVSKDDDTLGYDISSFETDGTPRYLEVKSTLGGLDNAFYISSNELAVADSLGGAYLVLRIAQLGSSPICCEVRHPFEDKLTLTPSAYMATFA